MLSFKSYYFSFPLKARGELSVARNYAVWWKGFGLFGPWLYANYTCGERNIHIMIPELRDIKTCSNIDK